MRRLSPLSSLVSSKLRRRADDIGDARSGIRMGGYDLVKSTLVKFAPGADPNGFGTKLLGGMGSGCVPLLSRSVSLSSRAPS